MPIETFEAPVAALKNLFLDALSEAGDLVVGQDGFLILTDDTMIGEKKTRAMAAWAERRGFATSLQERMFAADFNRQADEPAVA